MPEDDTIEIPESPVVDDVTEDAVDRVRTSRRRRSRPFPALSFKEALPIAEAIQTHASGQRVRRLTLFEQMGRSADSGPSKQLMTNSNQYGLTTGSNSAEYLELTEKGKLASGDESLGRVKLAARFELAITHIDIFSKIYEQNKDNRLPAVSFLKDFVLSEGIEEDLADECVSTFLANARDLGLLRTYAGAERLLKIEILLEEQTAEVTPEEDASVSEKNDTSSTTTLQSSSSAAIIIEQSTDLSDVCFLITPIGSIDSEQRKHADLMMGSLIEPALAGLKLRVVRADQISTPGLITTQIIDHILKAPLVIADLSYGNPNVFYELALRHASRKPVVQIIRSADKLPFDVNQSRTVTIDMTDIFTLVPQLDLLRAEISRQCHAAIGNGSPAETPLSFFYPNFWNSLQN